MMVREPDFTTGYSSLPEMKDWQGDIQAIVLSLAPLVFVQS